MLVSPFCIGFLNLSAGEGIGVRELAGLVDWPFDHVIDKCEATASIENFLVGEQDGVGFVMAVREIKDKLDQLLTESAAPVGGFGSDPGDPDRVSESKLQGSGGQHRDHDAIFKDCPLSLEVEERFAVEDG